jgi:hypothetical protein
MPPHGGLAQSLGEAHRGTNPSPGRPIPDPA